jgi:hypothetical protein
MVCVCVRGRGGVVRFFSNNHEPFPKIFLVSEKSSKNSYEEMDT